MTVIKMPTPNRTPEHGPKSDSIDGYTAYLGPDLDQQYRNEGLTDAEVNELGSLYNKLNHLQTERSNEGLSDEERARLDQLEGIVVGWATAHPKMDAKLWEVKVPVQVQPHIAEGKVRFEALKARSLYLVEMGPFTAKNTNLALVMLDGLRQQALTNDTRMKVSAIAG